MEQIQTDQSQPVPVKSTEEAHFAKLQLEELKKISSDISYMKTILILSIVLSFIASILQMCAGAGLI